MKTVDLLKMSPAGGCGCKLPLDTFEQMMSAVDRFVGSLAPSGCLQVGLQAREDAALYTLTDGRVLVLTVDFGTPTASEPNIWGRIATENALSDVYAVGGVPLIALSTLGWPMDLGSESLARLMSSCVETLSDASAILAGGHSISSSVPFFGLALIGEADPNRLMLIKNAQAGDQIILTKPIGTGIAIAAQKQGIASKECIAQAQAVMRGSNRRAASIALSVGIDAATDVTGYGLLGHLKNILTASRCAAIVNLSSVPVLPACQDLMEFHGCVPHSAERNLLNLDSTVAWNDAALAMKFILSDPQTSGGLLLCANEDQCKSFMRECRQANQDAWIIGEVVTGEPGRVQIAA